MALSPDERRDDALTRLADASESSRWLCAAHVLHNAGTLLADLRRTIDPGTVWTRLVGGPPRCAPGCLEILQERRFRRLTHPLLRGLGRLPRGQLTR